MDRYLHRRNTGSPERLAGDLGLPVLLPDSPLHRRSAVHFLWLDDNPHPLCYRHLTLALEQAAAEDHTELAVIHAASDMETSYYRVSLLPTHEDPDHG